MGSPEGSPVVSTPPLESVPLESAPLGSVPLGYLSFGDLDGDGLPEAVGTTADSRGIVVHPNSSTT